MNKNKTFLTKFREKEHERFYDILRKKLLIDDEKSEMITYAIIEISELIEKIYLNNINEFIKNSDLQKDKLEDIFDDMKFDFNEIRQLIETAKLTGLKYWGEEQE